MPEAGRGAPQSRARREPETPPPRRLRAAAQVQLEQKARGAATGPGQPRAARRSGPGLPRCAGSAAAASGPAQSFPAASAPWTAAAASPAPPRPAQPARGAPCHSAVQAGAAANGVAEAPGGAPPSRAHCPMSGEKGRGGHLAPASLVKAGAMRAARRGGGERGRAGGARAGSRADGWGRGGGGGRRCMGQ